MLVLHKCFTIKPNHPLDIRVLLGKPLESANNLESFALSFVSASTAETFRDTNKKRKKKTSFDSIQLHVLWCSVSDERWHMVDLFRVKGGRSKLSRNIPPTIKYDNWNLWIKTFLASLFQKTWLHSQFLIRFAPHLFDLLCHVSATFVVAIAWEQADPLWVIFQ